jgi:Outer membrane protein beta-barrel family/Carboxypeptidase regulatory-like domain
MKGRHIVLFILLVQYGASQAQNPTGRINGVIQDVQGKFLSGATVQLRQEPDSVVRKTVVAGEYGEFSFKKLPAGRYTILCTNTGYQKYIGPPLTVDSGHRIINFPAITLSAASGKALQAAIVNARKPLVEQRIDRTIVNVDAMISAAGGNALEVLAKTPGVYVDPNGDIQLNGKNGVLVLIDDKPTYLSTQDLAAYLRSLPGAVLDKIELMSNPPAKYDASGSAVINLQLKKNKAAGFNGNISLGYVQGTYGRSNNAVNLNYRVKKINIFGTLSYSKDHNFTESNGSRSFYDDAKTLQSSLLLNSHYVYQSNSWSGRAGLDYSASPNTTLGILLNGNTRPKTDQLNYSSEQYTATMQPDSLSNGSTNGKYHWKSGGINLNMLHKFDAAGQKITADLDYIRYQSDGDQLSSNAIYFGDGSLSGSNTYLYKLPSTINIYSAKTDYTLPLSGKARIDAGLKSSLVNTDNQNDWFDQEGGSFVPNYPNTNHFTYKENINAVYFSANKEWRRWALQGGLRAENTQANGHQIGNIAVPDSSFSKNYTHLFPTLYFSHKLDSAGNNTLVLSYSIRIRRPNYQQLDPFLFYINPYTYNAGNPYLNPHYNNILELKYAFKQYFGFALDYFYIDHIIYNVTQQTGNTFITRPENFGINSSINLHGYANVSPVKGWDINASFLIYNLTNKGNAFGQYINENNTTGQIELFNQFQFKHGWSAELNYFYGGKGTGGQTVNAPISNVSAGIQKKILKDKGTIRIKADDIFHGLVNKQTTELGTATSFNKSQSDTRVVGFSFSYRFGKAANARKSNHNSGGAADEQGRTN